MGLSRKSNEGLKECESTLLSATSSPPSSSDHHGVVNTTGTSYPTYQLPAIEEQHPKADDTPDHSIPVVTPIKCCDRHKPKPSQERGESRTINSKDTVPASIPANFHLPSNPQQNKKPNDYPITCDDDSIELIKCFLVTPITLNQLLAETREIYTSLLTFESTCINFEVDASKNQNLQLNNEQWGDLVVLHRDLLHEYHDFLLASQHPSASTELRGVASKYFIPARLFRHGIHGFLEVLRKHLSQTLQHTQYFLNLAYSLMGVLYETVPAFRDIWVECLGDLARYWWALCLEDEDSDERVRKQWLSHSICWYTRRSDTIPTSGRLYHHLAILSRPNVRQQLFYFLKSLCVPTPFEPARESIMDVINPILNPHSTVPRILHPVELYQCKAVSHIFLGREDEVGDVQQSLHNLDMDSYITMLGSKWMEAGYQLAIIHCCVMLHVGCDARSWVWVVSETEDAVAGLSLTAIKLFCETYRVVSLRPNDPNVLAYIHCALVFLFWLSQYDDDTFGCVNDLFPWDNTIRLLTPLLDTAQLTGDCAILDDDLPPEPCQLPEDYALRGLPWAVVPDSQPEFTDQFERHPEDWHLRYAETNSNSKRRERRILWLGSNIYKNHPTGRLEAVYGPAATERRVQEQWASIWGDTI